ncbi:MAG: hypothetical protein JWM20_35 [Patescibacteria group bacterium]|nr:hypothetical protein [Patescibacteria group bacterium]
MKKLIPFLLVPIICFSAAPFASADFTTGPTTLQFQNITQTSATVAISVGDDQYTPGIQSRQAIRIKYRAVSSSEGSKPAINGMEKEIPFEYTLDTNPLRPISITGLKSNQKYAVWLGYRAIRQCITDTPCTAIYIKYDMPAFLFSTKLDQSTVPTITKNLSFQAKTPDVLILKKFLVAHGYMTNSASTTFDIPMLVGVIKFQLAQNVTADGVIGSGSRNVINQWLVAQAQQ